MISIKSVIRRSISDLKRACSVKISSNNDKASVPSQNEINFETVFKFPYIKYISLLHRTKVYQMIGSSIAIPACGILEIVNVLPNNSTLAAAYIGITGIAVLCIASIPTINSIGFIYISDDDKYIKISFLDFWGRRNDKIIDMEQWIPLTELPSSKMDFIFLSPKLEDGTKYKLFVRYGHVLNSKKMNRVLE